MPVEPDVYARDVDFTALALKYPDFAKKLKSNKQLDFSDPESVRQLTKVLLHRDFDLKINLPEDRLCPPVPNRFNYIVFIQRLLDSTRDPNHRHDRAIGLDIGTGASAIYPMLACRQHESWLFLATEIDNKSRACAEENIRLNGLDARIKLVSEDQGCIIPSTSLQQFDRIDVMLTNPPFYSSEEEMASLAKEKARPPNSACTGAPVEMICPGGEVSFVSQIIDESALPQNKTKIQWYSSMLGKLGSVTTIIEKLKQVKCGNFAVTEFIQGSKTRRWCVAWSWFSLRPALAVSRGTDAIEKKLLPFPTELDLVVSLSPDTMAGKLQLATSELSGMDWSWQEDRHEVRGVSVHGDVWSRHARRRQKKIEHSQQDEMEIEPTGSEDMTDPKEPKLVVAICLSDSGQKRPDTAQSRFVVRWVQGRDSVLFESFHGWLKRKMMS